MYNKAKMVCVDDDNNENIVGQVNSSWEVRSFLVACEAIIRSALIREESRGARYRSDFQRLDDEKWRVNIYCRKEGNEMRLFKQDVKEIKGPLTDLLIEHIKAEHNREFE